MNQVIPRQILAFFMDVAMAAYFFRRRRCSEVGRTGWLLTIVLSSALLLPVYFADTTAVLSFLFRIAFALAFLHGRGLSRSSRAFFALYYAVCYTGVQNIFLVPFLSPLYLGTVQFTRYASVNLILCSAIRGGIFLGIFRLVDAGFPLSEDTELDLLQVGILSPLISCELYVKGTLSTISAAQEHQLNVVSSYPILLQALLLAFVVLFERHLRNASVARELEMQSLLNCYRIRDMESRQAAAADIRALHHDMKNHLLAIQQLVRSGELERLEDYTGELMTDMSAYEVQVRTGNSMLDALLSAKVAETRQKNIPFLVAMDFRSVSYISDSDLFTIFGNIVDNAMEACDKQDDPAQRFIQLRSQEVADQCLIILRNSFTGQLRRNQDSLLSTKNTLNHGIGLNNVKRTIAKYGGSLSIDVEEGNIFVLNILLPKTNAVP